jgi:hypothetical protein
MNRNIINSIIATAMCLGVAVSAPSVWGGALFNCTIDNNQAIPINCESEGPFVFNEGVVEQLELRFEDSSILEYVIGLNQAVNINGLFVVVIDCLAVEGDYVEVGTVGQQCLWYETENAVEVWVTIETNTKRKRRRRAKIHGRRF